LDRDRNKALDYVQNQTKTRTINVDLIQKNTVFEAGFAEPI
jgi:hypothetical protein